MVCQVPWLSVPSKHVDVGMTSGLVHPNLFPIVPIPRSGGDIEARGTAPFAPPTLRKSGLFDLQPDAAGMGAIPRIPRSHAFPAVVPEREGHDSFDVLGSVDIVHHPPVVRSPDL